MKYRVFDRECASRGPKKAKKLFLLQTFDQSVENVTLMKMSHLKQYYQLFEKIMTNIMLIMKIIKQPMQLHSRSCTEKDFQSS